MTLADRESRVLMQTYGRSPVTFVEGEGSWLVDADGNRYLDFLTGLAVTSLGHANPAVAAAVTLLIVHYNQFIFYGIISRNLIEFHKGPN